MSDDEIHVYIHPGTAPDAELEKLMEAMRDLSRAMGYDPDEALVFKIVRRDESKAEG